MKTRQYDVVFLGGGLSAALAAYRLKQLQPERKLLVLERERTLGGNHIWSFHNTDVAPEQLQWMEPFLVRSWPKQTIRFPRFKRQIRTGYHSVTSGRLHDVASRLLGESVRTGTDVVSADANEVVLADGERITTDCVIDCRGALRDPVLEIGYQKFVGHEVETEAAHGVTEPVIMDATVPQHDGYRFVYLLPFSERHLLIEDTYYSDHSRLDTEDIGSRILEYRSEQGWDDANELRRESGVLPVALGGDIDAFWRNRRAESPCACAGLRAALFHPTTGYSLPDAVALADILARFAPLETAAVQQLIEKRSRYLWESRSFFRIVNRMLFVAARPDERWRILQRFYSLSNGLIDRFYSDRLTPYDKVRILVGRPPIPMWRAAKAIPESSLRRRPPIHGAPQDKLTS